MINVNQGEYYDAYSGPQVVSFEEGEKLSKEAIRIAETFEDCNHLITYICDYAEILNLQNKCGKETQSLLERALALKINYEGKKTHNVIDQYNLLGHFHSQAGHKSQDPDERQEHYRQSHEYYVISYPICLEILGSDHITTQNCYDCLHADYSDWDEDEKACIEEGEESWRQWYESHHRPESNVQSGI
jgi:hypothetical protein